MTKPAEQESELYIILIDYSNDLYRLERRNGLLPAHAAVDRIQALIDKEKQRWVAEVLASLPKERPQTKYMGKEHSLAQGWNNCLAKVRDILEGK